jgi:serine/threonine protein kinase/tetratricopeptide (TPR) repeat protein
MEAYDPSQRPRVSREQLRRWEKLLALYQDEFSAGNELTPQEFLSTCPAVTPKEAKDPQLLAYLESYRSLDADLKRDLGASQLPDLEALEKSRQEPQPGAPSSLPQRFGEYDVIRIIDTGGMGIVFLARHRELGRQVAIKVPKLDDPDPRKRARLLRLFRREGRILASIDDPAIVRVYAASLEGDQPYLALELIEGKNLCQALRDGSWPPRKGPDGEPLSDVEQCRAVARPFADVCRALHRVHELGITHRDLKPDNIIVDKSGALKIIDFGLAYFDDGPESSLSRTGVFGTAFYMSPEQTVGVSTTRSPLTDVYGIGVTLYEVLSGRVPFRGPSAGRDLPTRIREERARWPTALPRQVPQDLVSVVLKCLEKRQPDRYSSAHDLARDLDRFVREECTVGRPVSLSRRSLRALWTQRWTAAAAILLVGAAFKASTYIPPTPDGTILERQKATQTVRAAAVDWAFAQELEPLSLAREAEVTSFEDWTPPPGKRGFTVPDDGAAHIVLALGWSPPEPGQASPLRDVHDLWERAARDLLEEALAEPGIRDPSLRQKGREVLDLKGEWRGAFDELLKSALDATESGKWRVGLADRTRSCLQALLRNDVSELKSALADLPSTPCAAIEALEGLCSLKDPKSSTAGFAERRGREHQLKVQDEELVGSGRALALGLGLDELAKKIPPGLGQPKVGMVRGPARAPSASVLAASKAIQSGLASLQRTQNNVLSELSKVRAQFEAARAADRGNALAENNLAVCLDLEGEDVAGVFNAFRAVAAAAPWLAAAHYNVAYCYHRLRRFAEAAEEYERALQLGLPPGEVRDSARLGWALCLKEQRNLDKARELLRGINDPDPADEVPRHHAWAKVFERSREQNNSSDLERFAKACNDKLGSRWVDSLSDLGWARLHVQSLDAVGASRDFRRALTLDPNFVHAAHNLAVLISSVGEKDILADAGPELPIQFVLWLEEASLCGQAPPVIDQVLRSRRPAWTPRPRSFASLDAFLDPPRRLIDAKIGWSYEVVGENDAFSESWLTADVDSSGWKRHSGPFVSTAGAAGKAEIVTRMNYPRSALLLRCELAVDAPDVWRSVRLVIRCSHGFVAYLNGSELWRVGVADDAVLPGASAKASDAISAPYEREIADRLQPGSNVIALVALRDEASAPAFYFEPALEGWRRESVPGAISPALARGAATAARRDRDGRGAVQDSARRARSVPRGADTRARRQRRRGARALRGARANSSRALAEDRDDELELPNLSLWRPEPILGLARCQAPNEAQASLLRALELPGYAARAPLWDELLRTSFIDLGESPRKLLELLRGKPGLRKPPRAVGARGGGRDPAREPAAQRWRFANQLRRVGLHDAGRKGLCARHVLLRRLPRLPAEPSPGRSFERSRLRADLSHLLHRVAHPRLPRPAAPRHVRRDGPRRRDRSQDEQLAAPQLRRPARGHFREELSRRGLSGENLRTRGARRGRCSTGFLEIEIDWRAGSPYLLAIEILPEGSA